MAPCQAVCFLATPIEFGANDGKPVHTLFTLVSPTVRDHTHELARLAVYLRDPGFRAAITRRAHRDEILREAGLIESQLHRKADRRLD